MSASKKSPGRQSNLFSYFQRKPKHEVAPIETDESQVKVNERENLHKGEKQIGPSPRVQGDQSSSKSQTPLGRWQQQKQNEDNITILDSDPDENSCGAGFLSCASSATPSVPPASKRRRVILSSDEEGNEREEEAMQSAKIMREEGTTPIRKTRVGGKKHVVCEGEEAMEMETEEKRPAKQSKTPSKAVRAKTISRIGESTHSYIDSFSFGSPAVGSSMLDASLSKEKIAKLADDGKEDGLNERFPHLEFPFLKPDKIKDAKGRLRDHPEYDARTLLIPERFLNEQTPGHRQWWKIKSEHFDTILFFKVGKFYELYHMDAVIAVGNLGLTYMRGKYAHCGFPEVGYGRFADQLVNRGYKVARVEQTETPQQLAERQTKEKVVRREICRITTQGTKTYGVLDGTDSRELDGTAEPNANYLMALAEKSAQSGPQMLRFGVCFVDCSTGVINLSEFADDASQSNLRTLLAHNLPTQLLFEKNGLSQSTIALLNTTLSTVTKEALFPKRQFRTAESTLSLLCGDNYLGARLNSWPEQLQTMLESSEATIPAPAENYRLALSALGAVLWYLEECLIDVDMVTMKNFAVYTPPSIGSGQNDVQDVGNHWKGKHMVLDGVALQNLHILPANCLSSSAQAFASVEGQRPLSTATFSLYNTINRCQTAFGKRLLRQWTSAPSCGRAVLVNRQKTVQWLIGGEMNPHTQKMGEILKKVPDLERLFQRIHTNGLKHRAEKHPDSRAQMFEQDKYNKRKIRDLLIILDGLEQVQKLLQLFQRVTSLVETPPPPLLVECLSSNSPEMSEDLDFFRSAFDRENALEQGVIIPRKGVDEEYDNACRNVGGCKDRLERYAVAVGKRLKCSNVKYFGTGKNAYQLEIPESACKSLPSEFELTSQRKGFKRYSTPELQKSVEQLGKAESVCNAISAEVTRRVFADFDSRKNKWAAIVHQIATVDCLLSLARYAKSSSQQMCLPEFEFDSQEPFIDVRSGYHPSLLDSKTDFNYIPNSCRLGADGGARTMLLTGPNMGGKSTFMRQVASLVVLAHITNTILRQASHHSLVLIDELGRGTSTHDGTAIACAVLKHIAHQICCRTLFSTHYHALCKFVLNDPSIEFAHMACMVENANMEDPTMESITFLYTLATGLCDKSYGFHAAKMAGLNVEVVRRAFQASLMFEARQSD